jgi:hypothetical protein
MNRNQTAMTAMGSRVRIGTPSRVAIRWATATAGIYEKKEMLDSVWEDRLPYCKHG